MKGSIDSQIVKAISARLKLQPDDTALQIADALAREEAALVLEWAKPKLATIARAQMKPERAPDPFQMFLPGFHGLSDRIPLKKGSVPLRLATVAMLKESLRVIRAAKRTKADPREKRIVELLSHMQPLKRRRLTAQRYCELAAAGEVAPVPQDLSMKRAKAARARKLKAGAKNG